MGAARKGNLRSVVESARFEREKAAIGTDPRRIDEALEGVMWALARGPERGVQIDGYDLWALPTYPWDNCPEMVVYYTFDDNEVSLESVIVDSSGSA